MDHKFEEFSKALAGAVSRRDAVKIFGAGIVGGVLALIGVSRSPAATKGWSPKASGGHSTTKTVTKKSVTKNTSSSGCTSFCAQYDFERPHTKTGLHLQCLDTCNESNCPGPNSMRLVSGHFFCGSEWPGKATGDDGDHSH